jgi:ketosteroid isomerase-like protein
VVAAQAETSLEQTVSQLLERLDAMELDAVGAMVDDEVQGVDEIARRWMRGRPAIEGYLAQLMDTVSDVHSRMSDVREAAWGDAGLVTFVLDQTYMLDGQQQTISAPTSIVFRRRPSGWKVVLIHTVPLPEEA